MTTDDGWGLDNLTVGVTATNTVVASGGSTIDKTPLLKGTYSANLAVDEEIQVFDGTTLLGTATIEPNSHTWTFQVPTAASIGSHSYSVKIVDGAGVATALSTAYSVNVLSTPLALDLNGDGVQTTTLTDGATFDLTADGSANAVSWIDHHDGFLALDRNGDGVINDGSELFGGATQLADGSTADDGWAALAQFDLNGDKLIDAKDAIYKDLKVWVDADGNGGTGEGELKSLEDLGIASINLNHDANQVAQNGNILQGFSSFTTIDGQEHQIVDAWLQVGNTLEDLVANSEFTAIEAPVAPATGTEILNPVLDTTAVSNVLADQQLVQHTL